MTAPEATAHEDRIEAPSHKTGSLMNESPSTEPAVTAVDKSIFTILGGTTIPDRAALVRAECREGSRVELRRRDPNGSHIDVWLECSPRLPLIPAWKMIGHVPDEVAVSLLPLADKRSTVIGLGTVKTVYAPAGRDEAVVTVEITPQSQS